MERIVFQSPWEGGRFVEQEIMVQLLPRDGAYAEAIEALAPFEPCEETHLVGLRHVVAYFAVNASGLARSLEPLLQFLRARQDRDVVEKIVVSLGLERSVTLERFHIDNAREVSDLVKEIAEALGQSTAS